AGLAPAPKISDHLSSNVRVRAGLAPAPKTNRQFELSRIGRIIDEEWKAIPRYFDNTLLDEHVIMPDHFHGIIMFTDTDRGAQASRALTLGMVIASFKSRCAIRNLKFLTANHMKEIGKIWHRNYYEHIIRDKNELSEIRHYIRNNPIEWEKNTQNDRSLHP
ncbi:transposase, partial [bacterium]|nr:transposase [candidate division CSSED10-310 bacterium]